MGYSIKAKGIANDLFGNIDNYVLPVQELNHEEDLLNKFLVILNNEEKIKNHLNSIIPDYKKRVFELKELI